MSSATTARKKVKASMMNAIHDLPLLVARDEGFFADQGLDVEIVKTPGTGQRGADHQALRDNIFKRTMESLYEQGECDQGTLSIPCKTMSACRMGIRDIFEAVEDPVAVLLGLFLRIK